MDIVADTNGSEVKQIKPPPIVVDISNPFMEIHNLLDKECYYKSSSIGTKVFSPKNEKYEHWKKIFLEKLFEFYFYNSKENRLYTTFLYGLPRISMI